MLDYTQSFEEFASSLGPTDIALYAGFAMVLWVLFKDNLNPVKRFVNDMFAKISEIVTKKTTKTESAPTNVSKQDLFFKLVCSWKQTRDLAVQSNCLEAVKVADQMFPFLSPTACSSENLVANSSPVKDNE